MKEKLKYLPLSIKLLFLAVIGIILYIERELLYRFCRYPFPFIMCPVCDYPCFFQTYRLQEKIGFGAIATGLVGGRVFCGVVCPVGAVQDWLHTLKRLIFSPFHFLKRLVFSSNITVPKSLIANLRRLQGTFESSLRLLKYPLLLVVFVYSLIRFAMAFEFMPEWGLIPSMLLTVQVRELAGPGYINVWLIFLVVVFLGLVLYRPWCKYLCPVGLVFALFNKISFLRIKLERSGCTGCLKCLKDCTVGVPLSKLERGFDSVECVRCYNCVLDCPEGVVKLKPRSRKYKTSKEMY